MISTQKIVKCFILIVVVTSLSLSLKIAHAQAPDLTYQQKFGMWINQIEQAESHGNEMLVDLDVNGKYSYGCLQFQMGTWDAYSKKYGIDEEIMDCSAQKQLAYDMVTSNYSAWRNWYNSTKKVGLPPE